MSACATTLNAVGLSLGLVGATGLLWAIPSPSIDSDGGLTIAYDDVENLWKRRLTKPLICALIASFVLQLAALFF
jgi:hypothetical protein